MKRTWWSGGFAGLLLVSSVGAQEAPEVELQAISAGLAGLQRVDGELWAGGDDYKASFEPGRVHFVPALGEAAPRSYGLTWGVEEIAVGERVLELAAEAGPFTHAGLRARSDLGGGVHEVYDVGSDGIELSFVFDELPERSGDLVVRLALETDLPRPAAGTYVEGLEYRLTGLGGVRVGGVTGVDAAGREAAGSLRVQDDALELVLPESFVAEAEFPLVLDPLISGLSELSSTLVNAGSTDVAYDATNELFLVVWTRTYSSVDRDIWARYVDVNGSPVGLTFFLETSIPLDAVVPRVGNVDLRDRFFVVWWQRDFTGDWDIYGRAVDTAGSLSPIIAVADTSAREVEPAISSAVGFLDELWVAWENDDLGVIARPVTLPVSGDPVLGSTVTIVSSADAGRPGIAQTSNGTGDLLIVWEQFFATPAPGDNDLHGKVITFNGIDLTGTLILANQIGPDETQPAIDGDGRNWVVAYQWDDVLFSLDGAVYTSTVVDGPFGYQVDTFENFIHDQPGVTNGYPQVAFTGDAYVLAYTGDSPSSGNRTVLVRTLDIYGQDCGDLTALEGTHISQAVPFGIASQRDGTASAVPGDRTLIAIATLDTFVSDSTVETALWRTDTGQRTYITTGCGGGGWADMPVAIVGNPTFSHRLEDATPFRQAWLVLGFEETSIGCVAGDPFGCVLVPNPFSALVIDAGLTDSLGRNAVLTPLPSDPSLVGATIIDQWAVLPEVGGGSCPLLGVDLSDAVRVTIE